MKASPNPRDLSVAITQLQLAELACRLVPHDGETSEQLVQRALGIWRSAGELLAEERGEAKTKSIVSFKEAAHQGLLPSTRPKTRIVCSDKGVRQAVKRFFEAVLAGYDRAMKGRIVTDSVLRENKLELKKMRDEVLAQHELPAHLLEQLRQFQIQSRDDSFSVTAETIRILLQDADVGRRGFEL